MRVVNAVDPNRGHVSMAALPSIQATALCLSYLIPSKVCSSLPSSSPSKGPTPLTLLPQKAVRSTQVTYVKQ